MDKRQKLSYGGCGNDNSRHWRTARIACRSGVDRFDSDRRISVRLGLRRSDCPDSNADAQRIRISRLRQDIFCCLDSTVGRRCGRIRRLGSARRFNIRPLHFHLRHSLPRNLPPDRHTGPPPTKVILPLVTSNKYTDQFYN